MGLCLEAACNLSGRLPQQEETKLIANSIKVTHFYVPVPARFEAHSSGNTESSFFLRRMNDPRLRKNYWSLWEACRLIVLQLELRDPR